jgi:hypothetical protein
MSNTTTTPAVTVNDEASTAVPENLAGLVTIRVPAASTAAKKAKVTAKVACGCGCGVSVVTDRAKFLSGHDAILTGEAARRILGVALKQEHPLPEFCTTSFEETYEALVTRFSVKLADKFAEKVAAMKAKRDAAQAKLAANIAKMQAALEGVA